MRKEWNEREREREREREAWVKAHIPSRQNSSLRGGCCDSGFLQAVSPSQLIQSRDVSWVQQQFLEPSHPYSGAIPTSY